MGAAQALSLLGVQPFAFDIVWVAIILCGVPIILEADVGIAMGGVGSNIAVLAGAVVAAASAVMCLLA